MAKNTSTDSKGLGLVLTHAILAVIAVGVLALLAMIIDKGGDGWDVAAFLLVLQSVIGVVRSGQSQHSIDRSVERLADSQPLGPPLALPAPDTPLPPLSDFDHYNSFDPDQTPATEAADAVADAASDKRDEINRKG